MLAFPQLYIMLKQKQRRSKKYYYQIINKMNTTPPSKAVFKHNKKYQRKSHNPDPISNILRASMIAKMDNFYTQLNHNKNILQNTTPTNKNSISIGKSNAIAQRNKDTPQFRRTTRSLSQRQSIKQVQGKRSITQVSQFNATCRTQYFKKPKDFTQPLNCLNIRQLLIKKNKIKQKDQKDLIQNPYYKIMKKRLKTEANTQNETIVKNQENNQSKRLYKSLYNKVLHQINHQHLRDIHKTTNQSITSSNHEEQVHQLKSNYTYSEWKNHFRKVQPGEGSRQRSETKIYEEIKKYFQQKYCKYRQQKHQK